MRYLHSVRCAHFVKMTKQNVDPYHPLCGSLPFHRGQRPFLSVEYGKLLADGLRHLYAHMLVAAFQADPAPRRAGNEPQLQ